MKNDIHEKINKLGGFTFWASFFFIVHCLIHSSFLIGSNSNNNKTSQIITWENNVTVDTLCIIENDETLIIKPGANITFTSPDRMLTVYGTVLAEGDEGAMINFSSDNPDGWGGIELTHNKPANFEYCNFSGINRGVSPSNENNGGIRIHLRPNVSFKHCNYIDNKGGIIVVNSSGVTIENCVFESNTLEGDFLGLLFFYRSTSATIRYCMFNNNKTNLDGLISVNSGSEVIVQNNSFLNTSHEYSNHFQVDNRGYSVIYAGTSDGYPTHLVLTNNHFQNNFGVPGSFNLPLREICLIGNIDDIELSTALIVNNVFLGSPFLNYTKTSIHAENGTFSAAYNQFKFYSESAIFLDFCNANMVNNLFAQNIITESAIRIGNYQGYTGNPIHIMIEANTFTNNRSKISGENKGASIRSSMTFNPNRELSIIYNTFKNNSTPHQTGKGGSIFIEGGGNLSISNNFFENNFSNNRGGSICLVNPKDNVRIKSNIFFNDSTVLFGGAIYIEGNGNPTSDPVLIRKNDFLKNSSGQDGGAVYIKEANVHADSNSFMHNSAETGGGGLFLHNIFASTFDDNLFRHNRSDNGGGLFIEGAQRGPFVTIQPIPTVFMRNIFTENRYKTHGGGAYVKNSHNISFYENLFSHNFKDIGAVNSTGGGIYVLNSNLSFYNSMFISNEADFNKGSLCFDIDVSNTLRFQNCNVVDNHDEGGMYFKNQIMTDKIDIRNSLFYGLGLEYNAMGSKAIIYFDALLEPIETYFSYFDLLPVFYDVVFFNEVVNGDPGWNEPDIYLLDCENSVCVDTGDYDFQYNDILIPPTPSCRADTNDIGITGGPHATINNPSIDPTQFNRVKPAFEVEVICQKLKTVKITDQSEVDVKLRNGFTLQWLFSDGNKTEVFPYSENHALFHSFDCQHKEISIVMVATVNHHRYLYHRTINFTEATQIENEHANEYEVNNTTVGLFERVQLSSESITIYPNPTSGTITISNREGEAPIVKIIVYDIYGKAVHSQPVNEMKEKGITVIDLSGSPKGVYILKAITHENKIFTGKLLIQ